MTPDQEAQVLSSLYDRLFDAITYSPPGKPTGQPAPRMLMCKNMVLNPADFANALSPLNPGPSANQNTALAFSALVDAIPEDQPTLYIDSGRKVSDLYSGAVNGANTANKPNPAQEATYQKAFNFLNVETRITNWDGSTSKTTGPSPIATAYANNRTSYINAVTGYRTAYNGYDLSSPADQRAWNAVQPALQNNIDQAWNLWTQQGKQQVEGAQAALQSTINDIVSAAIGQAQGLVAPANQLPISTGGTFLLSYALASNWMAPASQASQLSLRSSFLNQTATTDATSYSTGAGASWGLWNAGGSYAQSNEHDHQHMDSNDFSLTAELIEVRIMRPWFNPLLFSLQGWWEKGQPAGSLSASTAMPMYPTSFVVARNVALSANFSSSDKDHIAQTISSSASAGWGPFSVSGSYSHSSSSDTFTSTFDGGTLKMPGLQVIAWLNATTPLCPPMADPASVSATARHASAHHEPAHQR